MRVMIVLLALLLMVGAARANEAEMTAEPTCDNRSEEETLMLLNDPETLVDMADPAMIELWRIVNDGVMGGVSESTLTATDLESALFSGFVSLENNGGFASIQARFRPVDLSAFDGVDLLLCGDGERYGFWLREPNQRVVHQFEFDTEVGVWQTIRIPFSALQPNFFGEWVQADPLDLSRVSAMSFIINNGEEGPFALEIGRITLYRETV